MRTPDFPELMRATGVRDLEKMAGDVSPRQYFRGTKDGRSVVVMLYPDADESARTELKDFLSIGRVLESCGLKTPGVLDANEDQCYAVLEDLGRTSFGDCLRGSILAPEALYVLATDVLVQLRDCAVDAGLPSYRDSLIYENRRQLLDYYMPVVCGRRADESVHQGFLSVWEAVERSLPPCPQGFVHADYHLENMLYVPAEQGIRQCALIDFQSALHGPLPYDLVNLLEDARIDVPPAIHDSMLARYCADMSKAEKEAFLAWFRVLAAQFHGRVLGLFVKLAVEQGRDAYLVHLPRLQAYMRRSLCDPVLAPMAQWFEKEGLDFEPLKALDGDHIRRLYRNES